ncbi:hypothetical protein ACFU6K_34215 [Kitasatospora sp. NPDC057512]|uniref:hypothetical protein n=1 Tax=Kitasatospora sp. NPDC057512 TaxID=3346154 RepID=UPI00367CA355
MRWLFVDETNNSPKDGTFFICGGLAMESSQIAAAHDMVQEVREQYGFQDTDQFKFQTASRPKGMDLATWTDAKRTALERASEIGVDLFVYAIHHGIASGQADRTAEYGLNAIIAKFGMAYLEELDDYGAVCIDRVDPKFGFSYFRDRFQQPLNLPDGRQPKVERVVHYSMSCDGASHVSSLVDLAIGGIRYCMNAATGNGSDDVAAKIMPPLVDLLWSKEINGSIVARDYGFLLYPRTIKAEVYKQAYKDLTTTLTKYLPEEAES